MYKKKWNGVDARGKVKGVRMLAWYTYRADGYETF
jgi:hypothetical protein